MKINYKYTKNYLDKRTNNIQISNLSEGDTMFAMELPYIMQKYANMDPKVYTHHIQCTDTGNFETKGTFKYEYWNGCIFVDVDYKKYILDCEKHNRTYVYPDIMFENVTNYLLTHYKNIFVYAEVSRSGKGFHFIFYFNVQRTENIRFMCLAIANYAVKDAFYKLGYKTELDFTGVFDRCNTSPYHRLYLTFNKAIYNNCSGECKQIAQDKFLEIQEEYNYLINKEYYKLDIGKQVTKANNSNLSNWDIRYTKQTRFDKVEYLDHTSRWQLFNSIAGITKTNDELHREWEYCAKLLPEENGHDVYYYLNVPWLCDWASKYDGTQHINKELLSKFGYTVTFKPKQK